MHKCAACLIKTPGTWGGGNGKEIQAFRETEIEFILHQLVFNEMWSEESHLTGNEDFHFR